MDYSAALPDTDNPGNSPWASSPQHSRTTFGDPSGSDILRSPIQPPQPSGYDDLDQGRGFASETETQSARDTAPTPTRANDGGQDERARRGPSQQPSSPQSEQRQAQRQSTHEQERHENTKGEQPQRYHGRQRPAGSQYKLLAKVTGLERTSKKDPLLKFDVYTNLPKFRTTQFRDVRRLHSEFIKLAEHLISANPESFVPAVPPPVTSAGVGTDEDEARVKASIQRWLNNVCGNEVLMLDEEMVFFIESDFGYSPVVRRKQPATGVRRKMIKQFAPPPDDTPELADARPVVKLFYLGTMDTGQKVDKVVKARRSLGLAEADLGVKLTNMHTQETHLGLANAYRKLGKIIQATGDYHAAQGTAEATTLGDPLRYHSEDACIVKETLTNRHILLRELLQAQSTTRSKLSAADRLKASSNVRRDKVDEAIAALDEAKAHENNLAQKCNRVTKCLVQERRKWFARTSADLRTAIRDYVLREIESERRVLATLEQVRPDIRAIDGSGGLSRLGREAHPAQRRASLASSQGPKGDAWSGVPRRQDGLNRSISGGFAPALKEDEEVEEVLHGGRKRAGTGGSLKGVVEEDEDRVDARNAASRLAQTTF